MTWYTINRLAARAGVHHSRGWFYTTYNANVESILWYTDSTWAALTAAINLMP